MRYHTIVIIPSNKASRNRFRTGTARRRAAYPENRSIEQQGGTANESSRQNGRHGYDGGLCGAARGARRDGCAVRGGRGRRPRFFLSFKRDPGAEIIGLQRQCLRAAALRPLPVVRSEEAQRAAESFDLLFLCPATLETMARLCRGSAASPPLAAARVVLSRERPVLIAPFVQNDVPGALCHIGRLLLRKHVFFVPFCQDGSGPNFTHLFARTDLVSESVAAALVQKQLQPVLRQRREPF